MIDLDDIAKEIREIINKKQKELEISFIENTHTYFIKDSKGKIRSDYPSVSGLIDHFYLPFDDKAKSLQMCNGDVDKQKILLAEWKAKGDFATNMGSRAHYELELEVIRRYGNYKSVREPEFIVNDEQINKSNNMILAGKKFLDLMINERKAVLLDTETTMGSNTLKYFGTPDKLWLALNKNKDGILLYCSDWKTNKPENFIPKSYHGMMYPPFDDYYATTLQHYYVQLPLYIRLLFDMLKGSKYENLKLGGCIVVLLKDDKTYQEYRVPQIFIDNLLTMDLKPYIKTKKKEEKLYD
jgi:hypothetical protein